MVLSPRVLARTRLKAVQTRMSRNADALWMLRIAIAERAGVDFLSPEVDRMCREDSGFMLLTEVNRRLNEQVPALHTEVRATACRSR